MGICDLFTRKRPAVRYDGALRWDEIISESDTRDLERKLRRAKLEAEDAEAKLRAVTYAPPIKIIKGAVHPFIEVQHYESTTGAVIAPTPFIEGIQIDDARRYWHGASGIVYLVITMTSGLKHRIRVERASADILLAGLISVWTEGKLP